MVNIDNNKINGIIHEFSTMGQLFHSYEQLLLNQQLNFNDKIHRKKIIEICSRCARCCIEARQLLLQNIENNNIVGR